MEDGDPWSFVWERVRNSPFMFLDMSSLPCIEVVFLTTGMLPVAGSSSIFSGVLVDLV